MKAFLSTFALIATLPALAPAWTLDIRPPAGTAVITQGVTRAPGYTLRNDARCAAPGKLVEIALEAYGRNEDTTPPTAFRDSLPSSSGVRGTIVWEGVGYRDGAEDGAFQSVTPPSAPQDAPFGVEVTGQLIACQSALRLEVLSGDLDLGGTIGRFDLEMSGSLTELAESQGISMVMTFEQEAFFAGPDRDYIDRHLRDRSFRGIPAPDAGLNAVLTLQSSIFELPYISTDRAIQITSDTRLSLRFVVMAEGQPG